MVLHPKVLQLRNSIGTSPILYAHKRTQINQPEAIREMNSKSDNGRLLKQYFAIWGVADDYGTVPIKGCFSKSIQERGPSSNATYKITALWQHKQAEPLAIPSVLKEDEIGLYGEVSPDEGVETCDRCVIQVRSGTVNNGSYGFNYIWDKIEYDEAKDVLIMKECDLYEISFVTIGSQRETFGIRSANEILEDELLTEETEDFIKKIVPRRHQLEIRSLIDRHITLAKLQPSTTLEQTKPKQGLDLGYMISKLKN